MKKRLFILSLTAALIFTFCSSACAQTSNKMVRLAKLVIDSAQLDTYKAILKEEIETSVFYKI